ncbi:Rtf2 RING-finger-domain-containing protein, partial [Thamnocephalis sphaerospora]
MGNDGGSIPKRHELVKEKKKDPKADERQQAIARWFYCALSKNPLRVPVVADLLGTLYNREAILELLLDRSSYGDADVICAHVRSLKDVVTLKLAPNPALESSNADNSSETKIANGRSKGVTVMGADDSTPQAAFVCPITQREMNGRYRFVFSRRCGCVVSEQAVKEVNDDQCLVVG